jgi:flagellar basal body P-ring formation protein FlgA
MIRNFLAAAIIFIAFSAPTQAQINAALQSERPTLRSEATVFGDVVRIGDLIDHAGIVAKTPIFRAPDLGVTGTVSTDAVLEAVRVHAIVGLDPGNISEIAVTRASRAIPASEIESPITHALAAQYPLGPAKDIVLNFDSELHTIYVEPSAKGEPRLEHISFDTRNGRFDALLDMPNHRLLRLTGKAVPSVEVLSVSRAIARGEIIRNGDVIAERRARAEVSMEFVGGSDQAIGLAARTSLKAGQILAAGDLMKPEMIQRNETVTLVYEVPGITLTVRGKASNGGAKGDVISVLNEQSKRGVQGVIVGPGRVVVSTESPKLVANAEAENSKSDSNAQ